MKLQLKTDKITYTVETDDDCLSADEYFEIFYGLMIQATFEKEQVLASAIRLVKFLEE
jgi:hypothetical protein